MVKNILITGTSSGFGRLMARTLAGEGHNVIAAMRHAGTKNAATATELSALDHVEVIELDVTDNDSVDNTLQTVLSKYGNIDVLINNAGVIGFGSFEATSVAQMQAIFDVNVWGPIRCTQAILPSMRASRSGLIINISSVLGLFAAPYLLPYAMSKFALEGMTEGLRSEVKNFNIETVSIAAGPFPTAIGTKADFSADRYDVIRSYGPEAKEELRDFAAIMFEKMEETKADPQEVAEAVKYLVKMAPGTRPAHFIVNRAGKGADEEFVLSKAVYKKELFANMGWEDFV